MTSAINEQSRKLCSTQQGKWGSMRNQGRLLFEKQPEERTGKGTQALDEAGEAISTAGLNEMVFYPKSRKEMLDVDVHVRFKILLIYLRERESESIQAEGAAEGEGEAGSPLSKEPHVGLHSRTHLARRQLYEH